MIKINNLEHAAKNRFHFFAACSRSGCIPNDEQSWHVSVACTGIQVRRIALPAMALRRGFGHATTHGSDTHGSDTQGSDTQGSGPGKSAASLTRCQADKGRSINRADRNG
jgi:hypothetical protein